MKNLEIGAVYKHYKGTKVKVLGECFHSETEEPMVIYIHLEDGSTWVRPREMFLENVIINGVEMERFEKIEQTDIIRPNK